MFAYYKLSLLIAVTATLGCTFDSSNVASQLEDSGIGFDARASIDAIDGSLVDADVNAPDASLIDSGFSTGQPDAAPDATPDAAPDAAPDATPAIDAALDASGT